MPLQVLLDDYQWTSKPLVFAELLISHSPLLESVFWSVNHFLVLLWQPLVHQHLSWTVGISKQKSTPGFALTSGRHAAASFQLLVEAFSCSALAFVGPVSYRELTITQVSVEPTSFIDLLGWAPLSCQPTLYAAFFNGSFAIYLHSNVLCLPYAISMSTFHMVVSLFCTPFHLGVFFTICAANRQCDKYKKSISYPVQEQQGEWLLFSSLLSSFLLLSLVAAAILAEHKDYYKRGQSMAMQIEKTVLWITSNVDTSIWDLLQSPLPCTQLCEDHEGGYVWTWDGGITRLQHFSFLPPQPQRII